MEVIFSGKDEFGRLDYSPACNLFCNIAGIGSGKTTSVARIYAYFIYWLHCLKNPIDYFGKDDRSATILFMCMAPTEDKAQKLIYKKTYDEISQINWFKEKGYAPDPRNLNQMNFYRLGVDMDGMDKKELKHHKVFLNVRYSAGLARSIVGEDLLVCGVDEASTPGGFDLKDGRDKCVEIFETADQRRKSRFHEKGLNIFISSAGTEGRWLEQMLQRTESYRKEYSVPKDQKIIELDKDIKVYAVRRPTYECDPYYAGKPTFHYKVSKTNEKGITIDYNLEIPEDYRNDMEVKPEQTLRDICAVPSASQQPFFSNWTRVLDMINKERVDPLPDNGRDEVMPVFKQADGTLGAWEMLPEWFRGQPGDDIYCAIDLGTGGTESSGRDACGLALSKRGIPVLRDGMEVPTVDVLLSIRFKASKRKLKTTEKYHEKFNDEIMISDVREFVQKLHTERGFQIAKVSYDGFMCLSAGTLILTNQGLIPIEEVKIGDMVESRIGPRAVSKTFQYSNVPTIKIATQHTDVLEGTPNHKIEALQKWSTYKKGYGACKRYPIWEWKRLDELKIGDVVRVCDYETQTDTVDVELICPSKESLGWRSGGGRRSRIDNWEFPTKMTVELAEWLGLIWGDGTYTENTTDGIGLTVTHYEKQCGQRIFNALFGEDKCQTHDHNSRNVEMNSVDVNARWLVRWMRLNGMEKPLVPQCIMKSSKKCKAAFIRGLFATDGSVKKRDGQSSFNTVHYELARQIKILLMSEWGFGTNIATAYTTPKNLPGGRQDGELTESFHVSVRGSRKKFYDTIGFSYESKKTEIEKHLNIPGRKIFTKVKNIENSESNVYDLHIDDDPSYIANGFISHNSLESIQILNKLNYNAEKASCTKDTWENCREMWYDGRINIFHDSWLLYEMSKLEDKGMYVVHAYAMHDDEAQAMARAVELATEGFVPDRPKPRARCRLGPSMFGGGGMGGGGSVGGIGGGRVLMPMGGGTNRNVPQFTFR